MVGEEVVDYSSEVKALPQGAGEIAHLKLNGYFEPTPHLLVRRRHVGANSPEGRRLSRLNELLLNRKTAAGDQLAKINKEISGLLDELDGMAAAVSKGEL